MKYTILIIVLLLAVAGIFLYTSRSANEPVPLEESTDGVSADVAAEGMVVRVDLDEMMVDGPARIFFEDAEGNSRVVAVPSMGLPLCAAAEHIAPVNEIDSGDSITVRGIENEAGEIVPCEDVTHYLQVNEVVGNEEFDFTFAYPKAPAGYVLEVDDSRSFSTDPQYMYGLMLTERNEYEAFQNATDAREGPPTIQLRIYENPENHWPAVWAMRNPRESNVELAFAEPTETNVSGAKAINYLADGLYPIDTYVVTHGDHVYLLTGSYLAEHSKIRADFLEVIGGFAFIPNSEQE